jgi:hypothetical protein
MKPASAETSSRLVRLLVARVSVGVAHLPEVLAAIDGWRLE